MSYYHSLVPFTWMVLFKTIGIKLTGFKTGWSVRRQAEEELRGENVEGRKKCSFYSELTVISFPQPPVKMPKHFTKLHTIFISPLSFLQLPKCHSTQWLKSAITFFWIAVFSHLSSMHKPAGNETSLRNPSLNLFLCFGHIFCPAYLP